MLPMLAQAQSLTLEECKQMAHDNYPAVKQYDLIELSRDYTLENAQNLSGSVVRYGAPASRTLDFRLRLFPAQAARQRDRKSVV